MSEYQYPAQLPVTTTGGWARPGWWDVVADGEKAGRFGPADRQELLDDYCQLAIYDQEASGLDILTDGEHRRGGWIEGITGKMAGLALNLSQEDTIYRQILSYRKLPSSDFSGIAASLDRAVTVS